MNPRLWAILGCSFVLCTIGDSMYTLQSTFYPAVAELKNASTFQYTTVFAAFEATIAISSPFIGTMNMNPKSAFVGGYILQGSSVLFFGFVDKLPSVEQFLGVSIILRILEGFGLSLSFVGFYGLIALLFPEDKQAFIMGLMEMCVPLGFLVGPIVGSLLYGIGGFTLPFLASGGTIIILTFTTDLLISTTKESCKETNSGKSNFLDLLALLSNPAIGANFIVIFGLAVGFGFIFAILEPFLRHQFHLSESHTAVIFGVSGLLYSIFSPLVGLMSEHRKQFLRYLILSGLFVNLIGLVLVGPVAILPFKPNIITTIVGMILFGMGTGVTMFSAFLNALHETKLHGYPEDSTGLVSGLYISCFSFGSMTSPISGILYDTLGFRTALYFPVSCILILMIVVYLTKFSSSNSYSRVQLQDIFKEEDINLKKLLE